MAYAHAVSTPVAPEPHPFPKHSLNLMTACLKADPPDVTDPKHYSETLLRLEPCFLCYNPDTPPFWDVYPNPKGMWSPAYE